MHIEKIGIGASIVGSFIMAVFGMIMAYYTRSEAILLDGAFNALSCLLSIGSFVVSLFVSKGYTKNHPMGFYTYEAFMIFVKGVFILGLVVMAFYSNLSTLLSGGRELDIEGMLFYAVPGIVINLLTLSICYLAYKKHPVGLLHAEYEGWKINALITSVIAFALLVVYFLKDTPWGGIDRYIDQILVVVLCILTINDPIKLIRNSFKEMMMRSADQEYSDQFKLFLEKEYQGIEKFKLEDLYVLKIGRGMKVVLDISSVDEEMYLKEYLLFQDHLQKVFEKNYSETEVYINLVTNKK